MGLYKGRGGEGVGGEVPPPEKGHDHFKGSGTYKGRDFTN